MKKTISILMLGILPAVVLAGGDHVGSHAMSSAHDMEQMEHDHMDWTTHQEHESEAEAGRPGDPDRVVRTIEVTMNDTMRFDPAEMKFKAGETVRFVVRNAGRIRHEMVVGSEEELKEHAKIMRANPTMQHADSNMISLAPGKQDELVWQFDRSGTFEFACLVPGHLEAGMTGRIEVK